jgi:hypothetical protein
MWFISSYTINVLFSSCCFVWVWNTRDWEQGAEDIWTPDKGSNWKINRIMRRFLICTRHQMLLGWSHPGFISVCVPPIIVMLFMSSLHDVHEMNSYRAGHVCLSVRLHHSIREPLDGFGWNLVWTYATGVYSKLVLLNFLQLEVPRWQTNELMKWGRH